MSRTVATLDSDSPSPDGMIPFGAIDFSAVTGTAVLTRIAAGQFSLRTNQTAQGYVMLASVTGLLFRTGVQDDTQEFFGSSRAGGSNSLPVGSPVTSLTASIVAGTAVNMAVVSSVGFSVNQYVTIDTVASGVQEFQRITAIPDSTHITVATIANSHTGAATGGAPVSANLFTTPAGVTGRPPFTGSSQLTPVTTFRPKGISITGLDLVYAINTTAITVPTIGLFATSYVNAVAPSTTTLITQATNGLQTAAQATPYVINVPVPVANRSFITTPDTVVSVEVDFTTGGSGSVDMIGLFLRTTFNYD